MKLGKIQLYRPFEKSNLLVFYNQIKHLSIEEEQMIKKQFKGQKGSLEISLTLTPQSNRQVLLIQMINKQKQERVNLLINDSVIQQQDHYFTDNIESVAVLYETLISDFENINFTDDGAMLLEIEVLLKKKVEKKIYRFQGTKEEFNPIKRLFLQFEEMMKKFKADSLNKDERISELQRKQAKVEGDNDQAWADRQKMKQEIQLLRQEMKGHIHVINVKRTSDCQTAEVQFMNFQEKIEKNAIKIEEIKQQTSNLVEIHKMETKKLFKQIQSEIERYNEGLAVLNQAVEIHQQKINKWHKISLEDEKRLKTSNQTVRCDNTTVEKFVVRDYQYGRLITKVANNETYDTFVFSDPLAEGRTHTFSLKIIKTTKKLIIFGIGSLNTFGTEFTNKQKETLSYSAYSGKVFELGNGRAGGSGVDEGQVLTMTVNLNSWYVEWTINNKFAASAIISELLRSQTLYLFIMMANKGDMIQIL